MTFLLGIKFIVKPVMTTKEAMQGVSAAKKEPFSLLSAVSLSVLSADLSVQAAA